MIDMFSLILGFVLGAVSVIVGFLLPTSRRTKRAVDGAMVSPIERDWSGEEEDKAWAHLQKPPRN